MNMVCGQYCSLFALYTDRGYTGQQFVGMFEARHADLQVERLFASEFGALPGGGDGMCCISWNKR